MREHCHQGVLLARGGAFVKGGRRRRQGGASGGAGRSKWKVER
jgi:hypothetical protein